MYLYIKPLNSIYKYMYVHVHVYTYMYICMYVYTLITTRDTINFVNSKH